MHTKTLSIFALEGSREYGEKIAKALDIKLGVHEERNFEDDEHKIRPLESVRGKDVHIVHSLHGDEKQSPNDKLCRLLFFIGAVKDAGAAQVTAVIPYLCYARKDRQTKSRDPVTTRYVAKLFEAAGTDRILTIDVHNLQAYQNAFRCRTEHLTCKSLFAAYFAEKIGHEKVTIISPDIGGLKRAEEFKTALEEHFKTIIPIGFLEKKRSEGVISGTETVYGNVQGRTVIIFDDLIASGGTMQRAAKTCRKQGATRIYAAATHGLFTGTANETLSSPVFDGIIVTDTVPPFRLLNAAARDKLDMIDSATFTAAAIIQMHENGSVTTLNEKGI